MTGAEALYADMGHFGPLPIRVAWFGLVLPGLVLNYFGQGALLLRSPEALEHPFYHLAPSWLLFPLIGLATCATIIASQAVISGVFSLTRQAVRLGSPVADDDPAHLHDRDRADLHPAGELDADGGRAPDRLHLRLIEQSRRRLRHLGHRRHGHRHRPCGPGRRHPLGLGRGAGGLVFGLLLLADLAYLAANALKIPSGGWLPLAVAAAFIVTVVTWRRGRTCPAREALRARSHGAGLHRQARP